MTDIGDVVEDHAAIAVDGLDHIAHGGVRMHRVDDLHVAALGQRGQRIADTFEPVAKAFAAVTSDQDPARFGRSEMRCDESRGNA